MTQVRRDGPLGGMQLPKANIEQLTAPESGQWGISATPGIGYLLLRMEAAMPSHEPHPVREGVAR